VVFLRQHLDLTQDQLGRLLGLNNQQVVRWEKGQSAIGVARIAYPAIAGSGARRHADSH
jgi:DNA-binding transcriptional regulator YiaG